MVQKITGEAPFQVLATNFSISPSQQDYTLQISADGTNYSDLFTVSAGQTKMVTNVANGSYYRMKNNTSEVSINWRTQCNDGQGGGGGSYILPPATQQTLGGIKVGSGLTVQADGTLSADGVASGDTTILKESQGFPMGIEAGDVATDGWPYIVEEKEGSFYDVSNIEADEWLTPSLNEGGVNFAFNGKPMEETTLLITKVSEIGDNVFMCVRFFIDEDGLHYEEAAYHFENGTEWNPNPQSGDINTYDIPLGVTGYEIYPYSDSISGSIDWDGVAFNLNFMGWRKDTMAFSCPDDAAYLGTIYLAEEGVFVTTIEDQLPSDGYGVRAVTDGEGNFLGFYQFDDNSGEWKKIESGDNTILKAVDEAPATLEKGDVYALNAPFEAPEAPNGQTVYGGNITDFKAAIDDNNNQIWVNTWDDAQHTETTNQGYFELDKNGDIAYNDYQGDYYYILMDYYDRKGEWIQCNGVYIRWEGENLFFYVNQESNGVYFNPDVDMNFDSVGSTIGVYQANFKTQPNVKIEVDEGTSVDGTLENPEQVVTNYNGHMYLSFNSPSAATGKVCELESYGDYYPLAYDDSNDRWVLYSTDGETELVSVSDGQSRSAQFDGSATAYLSYSGGVLTAYTDQEKGWKNWEMGDGGTVLDPEELAKVSQLPAENRLVPTGGAYGQYLWTDGTNTSWNNAPSPEQYWGYPYEDGTAPVYSTSTFSTQWRKVVQSQDVKNIVKITVSDYETLVQNQQTDPNTLYLTYEPQV